MYYSINEIISLLLGSYWKELELWVVVDHRLNLPPNQLYDFEQILKLLCLSVFICKMELYLTITKAISVSI